MFLCGLFASSAVTVVIKKHFRTTFTYVLNTTTAGGQNSFNQSAGLFAQGRRQRVLESGFVSSVGSGTTIYMNLLVTGFPTQHILGLLVLILIDFVVGGCERTFFLE